MNDNKVEKLDTILSELKSFVVAFSGGVDSTFLLYRAHMLKKPEVIGVTIRTPYIPETEIFEASEFARAHRIHHRILDLSFPEEIRDNPPERCYICKRTLFRSLVDFSVENGYKYVIDGSNIDDTKVYRPGLKALQELGIRSPLMEAGLTKSEIRKLMRKDNLIAWDKPAMACLLTRIPYNTPVNEGMLNMIEKAERFLHETGYPGTRVRIHGDIARIECPPGYFEKIIRNPDKDLITGKLKKIGFRYVSLDLEGYRSGSADKEINKI